MWRDVTWLWIGPAKELQVCPVLEDDEFIAGCAFGMCASLDYCEVRREPCGDVCEVGRGDEDDDVVDLDGLVG